MINKGYRYAIIGFSFDPAKYGQIVYKDLKQAGYKVLAVNPRGGHWQEEKVFKSIKEIGGQIDAAVLVLPPAMGIKMLPQIKEAGINKIWCQPGADSEEISRWCQENEIELMTGRCIMVEKNSI